MSIGRARARHADVHAPAPTPTDPAPHTVLEWIARIADGDAAAFEALFHAYYDRLSDYAESYVRSAHAAEEIVDDVFLALWSNRARLAELRGSVASYLYVAVRNRALSQLRRRQTEQRYLERTGAGQEHEAAERASEVEDTVRSRELFALAERAIEALPTRARETYLLFYRQGRSYAEIAQIMGISVRTVENQLARSLKRLWLALHAELE